LTLHQFLLIGYQLFATCFVLGVASIILDTEEDDEDSDDDDFGGGILQPVTVTR
jgi:hypothetical protein